MLDLERVKRDERLLRALTGLNLQAFEALKPSFAQALIEAPVPAGAKRPESDQWAVGVSPDWRLLKTS